MTRLKVPFLLLACLAAATLASCAQAPSQARREVVATVTPVITMTSPAAPVAVALAVPTEEPRGSCVDCHMDKQQLIDTAKPEEPKTSESEGVG